ncbi:Octicosapeptide/Phox/Bem1p family protein [Euphorbia peplus]|nr:Octicosapeptide/Phox/Bem1p family protein [Euphorbia peplus]
MENYTYNSYPESGESSPRSREIDFENPTPWEDQSQPPTSLSYKAKFMCSYAGKIHPRPHDNQLAYIGGETKILAVDCNVKFSVMIAKLASISGDSDISFKYQLPGEDLDALISVTNDDDLEHMMHEYDRLFRASVKPPRMRLFLFPVNPSPAPSFGSEGSKSERDRFVDALNSGPNPVPDPNKPAGNVDFLFGLENKVVGVGQIPAAVKVAAADLPEVQVGMVHDDRVMGSDPVSIQTQLQRMQIREHEQQGMYRKNNSDENLMGGYTGDYYVQKVPEKSNLTVPVTAPAGYWPEKQMQSGGFQPVPATQIPREQQQQQQQQQVYVFPGPTPGAVYHTPMMRQVTGQAGQQQTQYYMQRMGGGPEAYREQQMYNMVPPQQQQQQPQISGQGPMGMVRPGGGGGGVTETGYAQMAYDNAMGRQVYYTAQGGVMQQQQGNPYQQAVGGIAVSGEMRHVGGGGGGGVMNQNPEGKVVVSKATQSSV